MIVISCNNMSKAYVVDNILENINFIIREREKIGLIGLNGSGKTTLLNILNGNIKKSEGDIYIRKGLNVGYLSQHTEKYGESSIFNECLRVFKPLIEMEEGLRTLEKQISMEGKNSSSKKLEKLMLDYSNLLETFENSNGYGYVSEINGVLKGLGFQDDDFHKEVKLLSGGQKARLALAKLLLEKPDLLLLDEPTNHLDIEAINWLESFLLEYSGAALIVSHDRYFLDNVVSKIFHLENKNLRSYNGSYSKFMEIRKKELALLSKQYEDQQKEIRRQEEIIERFMNYGDRRYIRQAQSRQKLLDKMKLMDRHLDSKKVKLNFQPKTKSGNDVLRVEDLKKTFNSFKLFENIAFNIYKGEKVGLIGPNGIGKTSLLKMIMGEIDYDQGQIILGHQVHFGYFDQEQSKLNLSKTVIDEIWDDNPKLNHYEIRTILSRFLFIGDDIFKDISQLSGGEKGRLALLKMMLSHANFLLMDEPTNHLDIDSKEVLEDALNDYEGTLLVISHDRYFLNRIANKILVLSDKGISEYLGNYDYYLEKIKENSIEEVGESKTKTQIRLERKREREKLQSEREEKEKLLAIEKSIEEYEREIDELDNLLCQPELYNDPDKILQLSKNREGIQASLERLYEEWIMLTDPT